MTTNNSSQGFYQEIHQAALAVAKAFKRSEIELIEILEKVDQNRVYLHQGYSSLFKYTVDALGLSEELAYIFINVSRKTREVPALKEAIKSGAISVSKAKKMTSVINSQNQNYWLNVAKNSSKNVLEKRVASCSPSSGIREQLSYVSPELEISEKIQIRTVEESPDIAKLGLNLPADKARVQLQLGISEKLMLKLRRAQDLLSQKRQVPVGLEEVLSAAMDWYIAKNDPLEKAKRQVMKGTIAKTTMEPKVSDSIQVPGLVRKPIPARTKHRVWIKYEGQCSQIDSNNRRCQSRRFLHIHHEIPVANGGTNELSNLSLLCSGHHHVEHLDRR